MTQKEIINRREQFHKILYDFLFSRLARPEKHIVEIIKYVDDENYLQILYTFGIETIQELLAYFLYKEDYDTCAIIRDVVFNHNKATGTNYKLEK